MSFIIQFSFIFILAIILIYFFNKKNFLKHNSGEIHQNYIKTNSTPLIGGVLIFIFFLINIQNGIIFILFIFFIFLIGFLSDIKKVKSAHLRLLLQIFLIILFSIIFDLRIETTRIVFLDDYLENYYFSILFTVFCVLIVVNGVNFIDGTNLLVIGYFIILEFIFIFLTTKGFVIENVVFSINLLPVLFVILVLNGFNKLYLGDCGAYLLGFIYSIKFIFFYLSNENISPFFIILILWYPSFEILFSILRKLNFNRSPLKPDSNHLHQLIYFYLFKKVKNNILTSNLVGISINIFNLIFFLFSLKNIYSSELQIILLVTNVSIYVFIYIRLFKFKLRNNF